MFGLYGKENGNYYRLGRVYIGVIFGLYGQENRSYYSIGFRVQGRTQTTLEMRIHCRNKSTGTIFGSWIFGSSLRVQVPNDHMPAQNLC